MLEGGPLLQDWWVKVSSEFVPYLNITAASPRDPNAASMKDKPDQGMLGKKGGQGFPHCIFMDDEGNVLKEVRPMDEASFRGGMKPVALLVKCRKAAAASEAPESAAQDLELIEAVFRPDETKFAALTELAKSAGVDADVKALFDSLVTTWPIKKAVDAFGTAANQARAARDRAAFEAAMAKFQSDMLALYHKGVQVKEPGSPLFDDFWYGTAQAALAAKDKAAALEALDLLMSKHKDARATEIFGKMREEAQAFEDKPAK